MANNKQEILFKKQSFQLAIIDFLIKNVNDTIYWYNNILKVFMDVQLL